MSWSLDSFLSNTLDEYLKPENIAARRKKLYEGMGALPGLVSDAPEDERQVTGILPNVAGDSLVGRFIDSALSTFVDQPRQIADFASALPDMAKTPPEGFLGKLGAASTYIPSKIGEAVNEIAGIDPFKAVFKAPKQLLELPYAGPMGRATKDLVAKGKNYYEGSREAMLGATGSPVANVALQTVAEFTPDILTAGIGAEGLLGASKKAVTGANLPPIEQVLSEVDALVKPEAKKLNPLEALNELLENNKRAAQAQLGQDQSKINQAVVDQRMQAEMQASMDPTIIAHEAETIAAEERVNQALAYLDNTQDALLKEDPNQFVNLDESIPRMYGKPLFNDKKLGYSGVRDVEAYDPNLFGDFPQSLGGVRQGSPKKIEDINAYEFRGDPAYVPQPPRRTAAEARAQELEVLFKAQTEASRELDDVASVQSFAPDQAVADKVSNFILFGEEGEKVTTLVEKQVGQTMSAKERLAKMKEHVSEQLVKNGDGTPETMTKNAEAVQQSIVENAADDAGGELAKPLPAIWREFVLDQPMSVPINKENASIRFYKAIEYAKLKAKAAAERKVESLAKAGLLQSEKDAAIYVGNSIAQVEDAGRLHAAKWAQSGTLEDEVIAAIDASTDEIIKQHKLDPNLPDLARPVIDKEAKQLATASQWLADNGLDTKGLREMNFEELYSLNVNMAKRQAPVDVFEAVQAEVQRRLGTQKGTVASFERIADEALCN